MVNSNPAKQKTVTIIIADDHTITRSGLALQIEAYSERFKVVDEVDSGYKALAVCLEKKPDILILDLYMPGDFDGFEVLKLIRSKQLPIKILVLTYDKSSEEIVIRDYKADGYLVKDAAIPTIMENIETLADRSLDEVKISARPVKQTFESSEQTSFSSQVPPLGRPLSPRELQILRMFANGANKEEIARQLVMTGGTVGVHLTSIYNKLGVHSRSEAIAFAFRNKLLEN